VSFLVFNFFSVLLTEKILGPCEKNSQFFNFESGAIYYSKYFAFKVQYFHILQMVCIQIDPGGFAE